MKAIRACPLQAHWLEGEPISPVLAMSGIADRYRRFVVDGRPVATVWSPSPTRGHVRILRRAAA